MAAEGAAVVRPRTTGELLDDAWRLYFADAPLLLLLVGVFLAPAFGALLLLAALPAPTNPALRLLTPLLPLILLVLTGLGSGACQEWLRARAEGKAPSFTGCLTAAGRRGPSHAAARAAVLVGVLLGLGVWLAGVGLTETPAGSAGPGLLAARTLAALVASLPALILWPLMATIHAFLASGKTRSLTDLGEFLRLARYDTAKTGVLTLSRLALLALALVNLHLIVAAGLWVLGDLAGFDAAFVALQLTAANPVYELALALLAWMLLAPFFEASNFLMHVDARTRQEGLDLQMQVQKVFPTSERQRVAALAVLVSVFFLAAPAHAAETRHDAVHAARAAVERITREVKAADPYDGRRWGPELAQLAGRLEQSGDGDARPFAWFRAAVKGFGKLDRDDGLGVLKGLDDRLALLEETLPPDGGETKAPSRDELKGLLQEPGASRRATDALPEDEAEKPKEDKKAEEKKDQEDQDDGEGRPHQALIGPTTLPGCGQVGLYLLGGMALAVVVAGAVLFMASRNRGPRPTRAPLVAAKTVQQTAGPQEQRPHERPTEELWREADALARDEQYLQAVRTLYLAVLSLLHRQQLLRFEPTRTNGEYLQQVRLSPQAPPELHAVFGEFTDLFERKWYGDRSCDAAEFRACRGRAEEIQALARAT